MKALVFNGVGDIELKEVPEPKIKDSQDAIVRITTAAICGTDLHFVRGTLPGVKPGTTLGHEGVGIVEQIGTDVHGVSVGDRVIVLSTIGCGKCEYCLKGIFSQCDKANPNGPEAGTALFGGPASTGAINGMQAEKVRVPYADVTLIKIPGSMTDDQAILLSDILPTSYMAVEMADVKPEDTVAVFGCGPVGQMAIGCLKKKNVKQIFAIDHVPSRLEMAKKQGAHTINFDEHDPVAMLKKLTNNQGPTKVIDAVGIDAQQPRPSTLQFVKNLFTKSPFVQEVKQVAPKTNPYNGNWVPGNGPSQVLRWAPLAIAKAGTFSIIGVYTPLLTYFPIGMAFNKNLKVHAGICNHRHYFPLLVDWVMSGEFDPLPFITQKLPFDQVVDAYKRFDKREEGWIKVILKMQNT